MNCCSTFKTLIVCQLSDNRSFLSYSQLSFQFFFQYFQLSIHHTVNYIIPPHMWVRHTMRNLGLPHLGFPSPLGPPLSLLCNRSFQSYQNLVSSGSWHSSRP